MERIDNVNRDRILWCCQDQGITVDELASETDVAPATIQKFLAGEGGFTFNQIKKIADYFGRGVLFFLEPGQVQPEAVHTFQFRTLANSKPELSPKLRALIERVEYQRDVYLALLEDIDAEDRPTFTPPDVAGRSPEEAAAAARRWLNLGLQNSFDSYRQAIEAKGVLVFRSNGYAGRWQIAKENPILGFSIYDERCPVIVVKKQDFPARQSFTLAHELGHVLLHRTSWIDDERDFDSHEVGEQQANAFAGFFLVPDEVLTMVDDRARPADVAAYEGWLDLPRRRSGASTEAILRRLLGVGRLSQEDYGAYRQWRQAVQVPADDSGNRQYRYREPRHIFGDRYVRTVLGSLEAGKITLARASTYLDSLKIRDLRQLEQFYAGH
ncbi:MAG: helix-turn-helix domain-containing protein [Pseudomonadota bacterium]